MNEVPSRSSVRRLKSHLRRPSGPAAEVIVPIEDAFAQLTTALDTQPPQLSSQPLVRQAGVASHVSAVVRCWTCWVT